jgi:hypothetical protein
MVLARVEIFPYSRALAIYIYKAADHKHEDGNSF